MIGAVHTHEALAKREKLGKARYLRYGLSTLTPGNLLEHLESGRGSLVVGYDSNLFIVL